VVKGRPGKQTWLGGTSPAGGTVVRLGVALTLLLGVVGAQTGSAVATGPSPLHVFLGYADGLRGSSLDFPAPWEGDQNVVFV